MTKLKIKIGWCDTWGGGFGGGRMFALFRRVSASLQPPANVMRPMEGSFSALCTLCNLQINFPIFSVKMNRQL